MQAKYCNAKCQKNHWPKHKKDCKIRAAKLRDEALFKDPPPMEDCPICFLPMPANIFACSLLPPATLSSVPIKDFAEANEEVAKMDMYAYYPCCGKHICRGCMYSFGQSGNGDKCPFCNSDRRSKTDGGLVAEVMRRVEANDAGAICFLCGYHYYGTGGFPQDLAKAMELYARAAELGCSKAHNNLADVYRKGGNLKKAKFHLEAAAMAGDEVSRHNIGLMEYKSGNMDRAIKHWIIAASAGNYTSMYNLLVALEKGYVSRESIDSTLAAYNNSCAEMRSEARDAAIQFEVDNSDNE
jgi:tetratricopeptide (TPR) repeat protein